MTGPDFRIEAIHPFPVAGVDEAGRGPLAGPVVAAAVVLDPARPPHGIDDSKKVSARRRAELYREIQASAAVGVGIASVAEIDDINIFQATMLAMTRAVEALVAAGTDPAMVLVDGNALPKWRWPAVAVVGGDALSLSIAAASIVAKETRDALMRDYDAAYPGYGWGANKGYGTKVHLAALAALGASPIHRRSFAPVRRVDRGEMPCHPDEGQGPFSFR